ncbi:MAG TPA: sugar porter family MFS transporter, partial [Anseongella sp.]|nr:sugar porter family MFS transporter [Anseongella sp.]
MEHQRSSGIYYLTLVCAVAALGGFLFGFDTAVISGVIGFVKGEFGMSAAMEGWFVSSALLGCIIGVAMAGKLSDSFGRKKVMLLSAVMFTASAAGCMVAGNETVLIIFRLVGGLGIGIASMVSPLYISEFAPARLRGRLVALYQFAITIGILCAYFSNAWLLDISTTGAAPELSRPDSFSSWVIYEHAWRGMLGMGLLPAVIFLACLFLVPESPRWLVMKGRGEQAKALLSRISGENQAQQELTAIRQSFLNEKGKLSELLSPPYRLALVIGLLLPFLSQVSGINAIIYYGPRILEQAGFTLGNALGGQVTIGIVNAVFTIAAVFTVDKWGRKPLLLLGVSCSITALLLTGMLFNLDITEGPWILLLILVYIAGFAFSFGPVCWIIIGEIYPTSIRGRAMSLATLSLWLGTFLVGQLTPMMLDGIGPAGTFWVFALLCSPT